MNNFKHKFAHLALSRLSQTLFSEENLLSYADKNNGKVEIKESINKLKEKTNPREILITLDAIKSDILCTIKQKIIASDEEYLELSKLVLEYSGENHE